MGLVAVVIRGPSGVGKSTVSAALAERLPAPATLVAQDPQSASIHGDERFRKELALAIGAATAEECLRAGSSVVVDGGLHWHADSEWFARVRAASSEHNGRSLLVRLTASLDTVVERDRSRSSPIGGQRIADYHARYESQAVHPMEVVIDAQETALTDVVDSILALSQAT